jgi:hypothetical protein
VRNTIVCGVSRNFFFSISRTWSTRVPPRLRERKNPSSNRIPSRLQERKIVNTTFSGDETFFGKQFNSKTVSFTVG